MTDTELAYLPVYDAVLWLEEELRRLDPNLPLPPAFYGDDQNWPDRTRETAALDYWRKEQLPVLFRILGRRIMEVRLRSCVIDLEVSTCRPSPGGFSFEPLQTPS